MRWLSPALLTLTCCSEPEVDPKEGVSPEVEAVLARYSEAAVHMPDRPQAHYNLGVALARAGRHADAESSYRRALDLDPEYALCYQGLGQLAFRGGALDVAASYFRRAVAVDSTLAVSHNNLGHIRFRDGDLARAVSHYEHAVRHDPQPQFLLNLGLAHRGRRHFDRALAMVERAVSLDSTLHDVDGILAGLYIAERRLPEALKAYRKLADRDGSAAAHMGLGDVYASLSELEKSAAQYRIVIERQADNSEAHHKLAKVLDYGGKLPEAVELLETAVTLDSRSVPGWRSLATLYRKQSRYDDAERALSEARNLDKDDVETLLQLGELYTRQGRYDEAENALISARDHDPQRSESWRLLGLLYADWGRGRDAVESLRRAMELDPLSAQTQFNLASALRSVGENAEADRGMKRFEMLRRVSEQVVETAGTLHENPDDVAKRLALARRHIMLGQQDKALVQYWAVLVFEPSHLQARLELVRLYVEKMQPATALRLCLEGIDRFPDHPELARLQFTLGQVYFTTGRTQKAEASWKRALETDPGYDEVHFVLGTLYESTERDELAGDAYREFLKRWDADSPKAVFAREALERVAAR